MADLIQIAQNQPDLFRAHQCTPASSWPLSAQLYLFTNKREQNIVKTHKNIILPVVLYGCETWSLTLREEHRLRVFENRMLRKISGPRRGEVTGEWRKLHNGELHNLHSSPDIIRQIK
jgi:hypothetical protein